MVGQELTTVYLYLNHRRSLSSSTTSIDHFEVLWRPQTQNGLFSFFYLKCTCVSTRSLRGRDFFLGFSRLRYTWCHY